jgi:hypothetical protein
MATYVDYLKGGTTGHPVHGIRVPYMVESIVDFAKQNAAAADVYRMIQVPAQTLIMHAGLEVVTALTTASTPTFDIEITGGTANQFAAAYATYTADGYSPLVASSTTAPDTLVTTADTIDLLVNTGTVTVGKIRVWAILCDISGVNEDFDGDGGTATA